MVQGHRSKGRLARRGGVVVAIALALAACGDDGASTGSTAGGAYDYGAPSVTTTVAAAATATTAAAAVTTTAAAPATTAAPATGGATATLALKVGTTSLGSVLVDGAGHTLYVFTKDEKNKSNCTAACLNAWPPLYGVPTAGTGVDASKLGSFATADGKTQATINGMPLYYFATDAAPGDVKGQNVGGSWFVVDATGTLKKA